MRKGTRCSGAQGEELERGKTLTAQLRNFKHA